MERYSGSIVRAVTRLIRTRLWPKRGRHSGGNLHQEAPFIVRMHSFDLPSDVCFQLKSKPSNPQGQFKVIDKKGKERTTVCWIFPNIIISQDLDNPFQWGGPKYDDQTCVDLDASNNAGNDFQGTHCDSHKI